jgi:DNA-binding NarL/FixJ family response regulator
MLKIFIVDDELLFRNAISRRLREDYKNGNVVGETSNGPGAITRAVELRPDILLMDIMTRKGSAVETIEKIHEQLPYMKTIILSENDDEESLVQAVLAGASAYLLKSCSFRELVECIQGLGLGYSFLTPSMAAKLIERYRRAAKSWKPVETHSLTSREREILALAAQGLTNRDIGQRIFISETTVKAHFRSILSKMEVKNRAGAIALATAKGIIREK